MGFESVKGVCVADGVTPGGGVSLDLEVVAAGMYQFGCVIVLLC